MTLNEMSESQRDVVARLRSIRQRHSNDLATQADVAAALDCITEILIKLGELMHYREVGTCGDGSTSASPEPRPEGSRNGLTTGGSGGGS